MAGTKTELQLPDLDQAKAAVLNSLVHMTFDAHAVVCVALRVVNGSRFNSCLAT